MQPSAPPATDRFVPHRWSVLSLLCVVAAPACLALTKADWAHGGKLKMLYVLQILFVGTAWAIPQWRKHLAEGKEEDALVRAHVRLNDAIDPLATQLGVLARTRGPAERGAVRAKIQTLALVSAARVIGPERTRACFFRLESDDTGNRRLEPVESQGRAGAVSAVFEEGTPRGDAALNVVLNDGFIFCRDVVADPPPGGIPETASYKTFISVAVYAKRLALGMLTVDSIKAGDLRDIDLQTLRVMANLLGAALADPPPRANSRTTV